MAARASSPGRHSKPANTWNDVGGGLNERVRAIAVAGKDVYVGGDFTNAGGNPNADHIARWNTLTSTWEALGNGVNNGVSAIAVVGSSVYVGGWFSDAGGDR